VRVLREGHRERTELLLSSFVKHEARPMFREYSYPPETLAERRRSRGNYGGKVGNVVNNE
jgi:hypothetical protein